MTLQAVLALPKTLTRAVYPETDQRTWAAVVAVALFSALSLKEYRPAAALVLILAALAAAAVLWRPKLGPEPLLYVLVAYLPFSRLLTPAAGTGIPMASALNLLIGLILVAHVRSRWMAGELRLELPALAAPIGIFLMISAWSFSRAAALYGPRYVDMQASEWLRFARLFGYFFLAFWVARDLRTVKTVTAVIQVTVTAVALLALWEHLDNDSGNFDRSRVRGVVERANTLSAFFVSYMFLLGSPWLISRKRWQGWLGLGAFLACFRGIMVTFSRGGYLGFLTGALGACWLRSKLLFLAVLGLAAALLANPQWLPSGIRYRLEMTVVQAPQEASESAEAPKLESSAGSRLVLWEAAYRMAKEHPWQGVGLGLVERLMPHYTEGRMSHLNAHNFLLNMAAECGVPAALAFSAILAMGLGLAYRLYRRAGDPDIQALALGVFAGGLGLLAANLTSTTMESEEAIAYFWILLGLVVRASGFCRPAPETARAGR